MKIPPAECAVYASVLFGSMFLAIVAASPAYQGCRNQSLNQTTLKQRLAQPYQPLRNSYQFPSRPANGLGTGP